MPKPQTQTQPTVMVVYTGPTTSGEQRSYFAFDERGEVLETIVDDGRRKPDWTEASICDARGTNGAEGFRLLRDALTAAEANAHESGLDIVRVTA